MRDRVRYAALVMVLIMAGCAPQAPAPYQSFGESKGPGSVGVHIVRDGDTLYRISQDYRLPMRNIIVLNQLYPPYILRPGYRIALPPPNEYKVKQGDTVYTISRMHDVSVNRLVQMNTIRPPYVIYPGQVLRLPTSIQPPKPDARPAYAAQSDAMGNQGSLAHKPSAKPSAQQASITPRAKIPPKTPPKIPKQTPKLAGNGQFMKPVEGRIISSYGPKDGGLYNDGINIQAVRGSPVRAAQNGVVVYTGNDLDAYGNLVLIRHDNKLMSAYAHLNKTLVKRGQKVSRGQSIATVGSTGQVDKPQLHFEIRRGSQPLNPAKYL